ncbi:S8 family peptidase [Anaerotaenia torta]|uniref:S8 family peptidase n=1 Tax=Anaerotaenia torta TaxID=433293 RepID=UPI003D244851
MNRVSDIIESKWAHDHGYFGRGVGVAIVDTGITLHKDFVDGGNRVIGFVDFINRRAEPYDDNGHGTHVAGIVGGNGFSSQGRYQGLAPECNLIGVKVLDKRGDGNISDVLAGLQWIIDNKKRYNIRVVNISVGTSAKESLDENSLLVQGVNAVWDSGIVVVVAAGNNGPGPMSISTPGISRKVITVGSSDDNVAVEVFGSGRTKDYSGRGPTPFCIKKPDIVAPGSNIISCNICRYPSRAKSSELRHSAVDSPMIYTIKSGTSMATPVVTGAIALLLSAHPQLSNREVKLRLRSCAINLGQHWEKQGWGLLNVRRLLEQP